MTNTIQVIDDFIPVSAQNDIQNALFGPQFPWYYTVDVTYGHRAGGSDRAPAFKHVFVENGELNSPNFGVFGAVAKAAGDMLAGDAAVSRCRSFLQLPLNPKFMSRPVDKCHVDGKEPHVVLLYYVCDSDGDTIVIDKQYAAGDIESIDHTDYPILQKVTPKKGRALLFDGRYYHTAEQPTSGVRCVANFNLLGVTL